MEIKIRTEAEADHSKVFSVIKQAFLTEELSDHKEQFLVERLRMSGSYILELSLLAEVDGKVVGHILLTNISICDGDIKHQSLALAPVSVLPEYQGRGVGSALIKAAHAKAIALGYGSVVILGHKDYYPRFGYKTASQFDISLPFDVPEEYVMAIELIPNALAGVCGVVEYDPAFSE